MNELSEGSYVTSGKADDTLRLAFLLSFVSATHVEVSFEGGEIYEVTGQPEADTDGAFEFRFPAPNLAQYDFSAGTYDVFFTAQGVDGEYRLELFATQLGGQEL